MKKVLIVGASGMIGGIVLRECLTSEEVENITLIVRQSLDIESPKVTEIVLQDFQDYSGIQGSLADIDVAYFCLGVYTGTVADADFRTITVDYAEAFADALKLESPSATLCFLSGAGADRTEKSAIPFAKYKGIAENSLLSKNFEHLAIFRPAYIYPVKRRIEPNILYTAFRMLYPIIRIIYPRGVITSEELGKAIFRTGLAGIGGTFENEEIKRSGQND